MTLASTTESAFDAALALQCNTVPNLLSVRPSRERPKPLPREGVRKLPARLGRYTLFSHIGRGGMADIYLATADTELGATRLVVIKEVLPRLADRGHFADMLVNEAKLAARLNHANIVKVEHLGRQGTLFIAMEYVEGVDLREMLRRSAKSKVPVPIEFSLRIVTEALRGLSFAHRYRGEGDELTIVHRDVSPSNVLLSFEGEVKLTDFGIARAHALFDDAGADSNGAPSSADGRPRAEAIEGKAGYMSPEQARGEMLDARADIYSVGIILWELCAGRRLYKANEGERLLDVARRAEIPALPKRGLAHEEELHAIVTRALAEDRNERYATAAAMLSDLEEYAMRARMVASELRFGAWLADHFAHDVVAPRRAGERAMRALSLGPAATLTPIDGEASEGRTREHPSETPTPTPSTFAVVERADAYAEASEEVSARSTSKAPLARRATPLWMMVLCLFAPLAALFAWFATRDR